MTKSILGITTAAALAVSIPFASPVAAVTPSAAALSQFCRTNAQLLGFNSTGACMAEIRARVTTRCRDADRWGTLELMGFRNRGECITHLRRLADS